MIYPTARHCLKNATFYFNDALIEFSLNVGAGLDHQMDKIVKSPANVRKVKRYHQLLPEESSESEDPDIYSDGTDLALLGNHLLSPVLHFGTVQNRSELTMFILLELEQPWIFGEQTNIYPACLMDFEIKRFPDEFLAVGYGLTETIRISNIFPIQNGTLNLAISEPQAPFEKSNLVAQKRSSWYQEFLMTKFRLINTTKHLIWVNSSHSSVCNGTVLCNEHLIWNDSNG